MICNKCGKELPNSAEFCNYCGYSFINPQAQSSQTPSNSPETNQSIQSSQMETQNLPTKRGINIRGMIKYGFAGLTIGFIAGVFTGHSSWTIFWITMMAFVIIFAIFGAKSKTKAEVQQEASQQLQGNDPLTTNEKIAAWVFCIINPVITGAIMYFMWRNKHPQKAKQANHISFIVFILEIFLGIALAMKVN